MDSVDVWRARRNECDKRYEELSKESMASQDLKVLEPHICEVLEAIAKLAEYRLLFPANGNGAGQENDHSLIVICERKGDGS